MRATIICYIILILASPIYAQDSAVGQEVKAVQAIIIELFDGYRAGDSARVANVFDKKAYIQGIQLDSSGNSVLSELKPAKSFVNYIGGGLSNFHDERLWDTHINIDELMATVWTRYAFFLGGNFSHCGTETILLRKRNNEWKIFYLADTRQLNNCQLPDQFK